MCSSVKDTHVNYTILCNLYDIHIHPSSIISVDRMPWKNTYSLKLYVMYTR